MSETTSDIQPGNSGFEGCEKKLEIDFRPTADLRSLPRDTLNAMLDLARCTIISVTRNETFDAYVLSESSLFVFPHKVIIKTCGTTSLLHCLPLLLKSAEKAGTEPVFVQFSRCNFLFPHEQPLPHRSFRLEVQYLNTQFDGGSAFVLGPINGARWHLYLADLHRKEEKPVASDQTLEIVMFDLDPSAMRQFYHGDHQQPYADGYKCPLSGKEATQRSGIDKLLPGAVIDDFLFSPCGYSCNGLLDNRVYFTIHITPEPQCSFVSFETNVAMADYSPLVSAVLDIFRPRRFTMQLFADIASEASAFTANLPAWDQAGFSRTSLTSHHFPRPYTVTCAHYESESRDVDGDGDAEAARLLVPGRVGETIPEEGTSTARSAAMEAAGQRVLDKLTQLAEQGHHAAHSHLPPQSPMVTSAEPGLVPSFVDLVHGAESLLGIQHHEEEELLERFHVPYSLATKLTAAHLQQLAVAAVRERAVVQDVPASVGSRPGRLVLETAASEGPEDAFAVVDIGRIVDRFAAWAAAFPRVQPHYAVKLNADHGILAALHAVGCGFACTTVPEMEAVLTVGASPYQIMFNNPWKSASQVRFVREHQVELCTFDSVAELTKVYDMNPEGDMLLCVAFTSPHSANPTSTSRRHGCDPSEARALLEAAHEKGARVVGITMSVGGATLTLSDFRELLASARSVMDHATEVLGRRMDVLDIGTGLPDDMRVRRNGTSPEELPFEEAAAVLAADLDRLFPPPIRLLARPSGFLVATSQTLAVSVVSKSVPAAGQPVTYHVNDGVYGSFGQLKLFDDYVLVPHAANEDAEDYVPSGPKLPSVVLGSSGQPSDCLVQMADLPDLSVGDWIYFQDVGQFSTSSAAPFSVGRSHAHWVRYVASTTML